MGPTDDLDPAGPHVGPMNFAIWGSFISYPSYYQFRHPEEVMQLYVYIFISNKVASAIRDPVSQLIR